MHKCIQFHNLYVPDYRRIEKGARQKENPYGFKGISLKIWG